MFNKTGIANNRSSYGVESIAVPGELAGYWQMYNKYGSKKVQWKDLFTGAIDYARNGFSVGQHLNDALEQNRKTIMKISQLRGAYVNPATNDLYKKDEMLKQPTLAATLEELANSASPYDTFYKTIARKIIDDIYLNITHEFPDQTPIIDAMDFLNYKVIESEAYSQKLRDNITVHTTTLPGLC